MKNRKTILIVSSFFPYPTFFGGAFDIWEKLKGFYELGFNIHLVYTSKTHPKSNDLDFVYKFVEKTFYVHRENKIKDVFSRVPLQVKSRGGLEHFKFNYSYDIVLLESESVSSILNNKTLSFKKLILRIHNNESLYFKELCLSTKNIFKKAYFLTESFKFKPLSKKVYEKADRLWFISTKELNKYSNFSVKAIHLPPPINQNFIKQELKGSNVLFVGSLFMENNLEALRWYLNNVHNYVASRIKDYKLLICGSTGSKSATYFENMFFKYTNIDFRFNVDNLGTIYKSATIFINPMQHGSGVKLKSINAISNGLPLVSTSIGSEGIGLKHKEMYHLANSPEEFRNAVIELLKSPNKNEMVNNAQNYLESINYLKIIESEIKTLNING